MPLLLPLHTLSPFHPISLSLSLSLLLSLSCIPPSPSLLLVTVSCWSSRGVPVGSPKLVFSSNDAVRRRFPYVFGGPGLHTDVLEQKTPSAQERARRVGRNGANTLVVFFLFGFRFEVNAITARRFQFQSCLVQSKLEGFRLSLRLM